MSRHAVPLTLTVTLCLLGLAETATAGQGVPLGCRRDPTSTLCAAYRAPSAKGPIRSQSTGTEIWEAPGSRQTSQPQRPPTTEENYAGKAVDTLPEKVERRMLRRINKEIPGARTPLKRGLDGIRFFEDSTQYVWDSTAREAVDNYVDGVAKRSIQTLPNGSTAKSLLKKGKNFVTGPGGIVAGIVMDPEEISTRQGVAGRPEQYTVIDKAYKALEDGSCLIKDALSLKPRSGFVRRAPECATREELQAYVDGYNREFDAIAKKEMQQWNVPREEAAALQWAIGQFEAALREPGLKPSDRAWMEEQLDFIKRNFADMTKKGIFPSEGSGPGSNDAISDAYRRMDSQMTIKPWR